MSFSRVGWRFRVERTSRCTGDSWVGHGRRGGVRNAKRSWHCRAHHGGRRLLGVGCSLEPSQERRGGGAQAGARRSCNAVAHGREERRPEGRFRRGGSVASRGGRTPGARSPVSSELRTRARQSAPGSSAHGANGSGSRRSPEYSTFGAHLRAAIRPRRREGSLRFWSERRSCIRLSFHAGRSGPRRSSARARSPRCAAFTVRGDSGLQSRRDNVTFRVAGSGTPAPTAGCSQRRIGR